MIWDTESGVSSIAAETMQQVIGDSWQCHRDKPTRCRHPAHFHSEDGCGECACKKMVTTPKG